MNLDRQIKKELKKTYKKLPIAIKIVLILLVIAFLIIYNSYNKNAFVNDTLEVKFSSCVDGDTAKFITDKGVETVRFLAVDTPELKKANVGVEPFAKEASEYTCQAIKEAKKIVLELDKNSDKYDKYDRLLAWIFIDDNLLQEDLIKLGYAKVRYLYGDYKHTNKLKTAEKKARDEKIGVWSLE